MIDLKKLHEEFQGDIDAVTDWCNEIYADKFTVYFSEGRELFERLKSKQRPITDDELSWILIQLPIQLFGVSEALNRFKISQEVVKLKNRQREKHLIDASIESTATKRQQDATDKSLEDKLLATVYSTIIDRVSSEVSFCKELIMGAKKIWDGRRRTEESNPVSEVEPLPDYTVTKGKSYIKGGQD